MTAYDGEGGIKVSLLCFWLTCRDSSSICLFFLENRPHVLNKEGGGAVKLRHVIVFSPPFFPFFAFVGEISCLLCEKSTEPVTDREPLQCFLGQPVADTGEKKCLLSELCFSREAMCCHQCPPSLPPAPVPTRIFSTTKYESILKKGKLDFNHYHR